MLKAPRKRNGFDHIKKGNGSGDINENLLFHSVLEKFLDGLHNIGHIEDFQAIGESHNFQQEKYSEKAVFGHVHEKGDWKERDEILEESGL